MVFVYVCRLCQQGGHALRNSCKLRQENHMLSLESEIVRLSKDRWQSVWMFSVFIIFCRRLQCAGFASKKLPNGAVMRRSVPQGERSSTRKLSAKLEFAGFDAQSKEGYLA